MAQKDRLQRGVGVALWRQIADGIRAGLAQGLAGEDGRLPPETELAQRFGVNRHTVRAAIAALAHEGVLQSRQGRGTYVRRQKRLVYPIGERTRFSAGLEGQARERQSEVLANARESATPDVAAALGIPPGEETIRIEVLGRADGVPVSRATLWFHAARLPQIAEIMAETGSVTDALARFGLADYRRASTAVEARHVDEADMRDLRLLPGAIVLVTRAVNVDPLGKPLQFSLTRFPADRVELVLETAATAR